MIWLDIACPHIDMESLLACKAQPGDYCNFLSTSGDMHPHETPHPERIVEAAAMERGGSVGKEEFDRAVEASSGGLA